MIILSRLYFRRPGVFFIQSDLVDLHAFVDRKIRRDVQHIKG